MIFYFHYVMMTSGLSGISVLLGVFVKTYTDASQGEIGALMMSIPFVSLVIKPLICSWADRHQAHKRLLLLSMFVEMLGYAPFAIIPFLPDFYTAHPRAAWYILVLACHVGNGGLGVAWSLGDCLAVNYSQRTGTPFGRMRLMGTLSWGVYGFVIGQINEMPHMPKYIPAFLILHGSLLIELVVVYLWKNEDFEMVDPLAVSSAPNQQQTQQVSTITSCELDCKPPESLDQTKPLEGFIDSIPSSVGGTLKIKPQTAKALMEVFASSDADELKRRLDKVEEEQRRQQQTKWAKNSEAGPEAQQQAGATKSNNLEKNPQLVLLKMILVEDGRLIKYIILFTLFGVFFAPMTFLFLSMEDLCHERGYNFSQLAGAVLISQALIETFAFLVTPYCTRYVSRWVLLSSGLLIMSFKYFFYAGWYYDAGMSPYWAVLAEWSHGIPYGIFCTIQADVALMFANQCRLFIPEMRRLGYLQDLEDKEKGSRLSEAEIEAQERSIKMALRATVQALFSGFQDGLGQGAGYILCGYISELYSYIRVWQVFALIACLTFAFHLVAEATKCRYSDTYEPRKGTIAHQIMELSRTTIEAQRKRDRGGGAVAASARRSTLTPMPVDVGHKPDAPRLVKPAESC